MTNLSPEAIQLLQKISTKTMEVDRQDCYLTELVKSGTAVVSFSPSIMRYEVTCTLRGHEVLRSIPVQL